MNALASPYRLGETPLMTRERMLEQELASTRYMLDALANEEVRVARCVGLKQAPRSELAGLRDTLLMHMANEERLSHELEAVRAEIVARGERKIVDPDAPNRALDRFVSLLGIAGCLVFALAFVLLQLSVRNTAHDAPAGISLEWGGPLEPGLTWLYVEGPAGVGFEVDGRPFRMPDAVQVSALRAHDVRFDGGPSVHVRRIPCTTAVVRWNATTREASVDRYYNSATCF